MQWEAQSNKEDKQSSLLTSVQLVINRGHFNKLGYISRKKVLGELKRGTKPRTPGLGKILTFDTHFYSASQITYCMFNLTVTSII